MKPVAIQGIGVVGAFGHGLDLLEKALVGCLPVPETICLNLPDGPLSVDVLRADVSAIERIIGKHTMRRLDRYSRMAVLAACQAMADAGGLNGPGPCGDRVGIIIATGFGPVGSTCAFLKSIPDVDHLFPSPTHFSNSVHNSAAAYISMHLGITGPALTVSQPEGAVTSALLTAGLWLAEGCVDAVLFGAVDEYADVLAIFLSQLYQKGGKAELNQNNRQLPIGEGSVFFLLTGRNDSPGGYGHIETIHQPIISHYPVPPNTLFFISGSEDRKHSDVLPVGITKDHPVLSYQAIYGLVPLAIAFDMAIALLSLKNRRVYMPWSGRSNSTDWGTGNDFSIPNPESIQCITWSGQRILEYVHLQNQLC
jgi:3-oxoacyl-[acyl-carrier-protein] synthase II